MAVHHLGIVIQTIDETLLDEVELGLHAIEAHQTNGFLLANGSTDILGGCHYLRISHLLLETFVDVRNELGTILSGSIRQQEIITNLRTVHQTKGVVKRIVLILEFNRFSLCRTFCRYRLACSFFARSHGRILRHDITLCYAFVHYRRVGIEGVGKTLQEAFAIVGPSGIAGKTFFLKHRDGCSELTTGLGDVAQYLFLIQVSGFESINKLGDCLLGTIFSQIVLFDLQTIDEAYCIVERVVLVVQLNIFCFVAVAAGNHCHGG